MRDLGQPWRHGRTPTGEIYISARDSDGFGGRIVAMDGIRAIDPADAPVLAAGPDGVSLAEAFLRWCNTDYEQLGRERACNGSYLRTADRAILAIQARKLLAKAKE